MFEWGNPLVQAAALEAAGTCVAAITAALCAAMIGRHFANRQRLREKLATAIQDIHFLLEVEKTHVQIHREHDDTSYLLRARQRVRAEGYRWSGEFTPGRVSRSALIRNN